MSISRHCDVEFEAFLWHLVVAYSQYQSPIPLIFNDGCELESHATYFPLTYCVFDKFCEGKLRGGTSNMKNDCKAEPSTFWQLPGSHYHAYEIMQMTCRNRMREPG